jgi:hypothetical protein
MSAPIQVAIDARAFHDAKAQIQHIRAAVTTLVEATATEHAAIAARDALLLLETKRLIGTTNPLTNKPHSQASAEDAGKQTDEYKALAAARIEAENARLMASAAYEAQKLYARLAVAVVEHAVPSGDYH